MSLYLLKVHAEFQLEQKQAPEYRVAVDGQLLQPTKESTVLHRLQDRWQDINSVINLIYSQLIFNRILAFLHSD